MLASMPGDDPIAFAAKHWGAKSTVVQEMKAAISGGETTDGSGALVMNESVAEFFDTVRSLSILGRMQGLRRLPARVPVLLQASGSTAYWIGESKAIPVSRTAFSRDTLDVYKVAALTVFSREMAASASERAIAVIKNDLIEAGVRLLDLSLIDPSVAGTADVSPASITHGVTPIASSGDLADDVEAVIAAFTGSLLTASWVMSPRLAAQAGIRAGGKGIAADLGARGGMLAGLPVLTSESVPLTSDGGMLALIDASGIAVVEEGMKISRSTEAMVEMSDTPTGATDTPTAATASRVSLFQSDSAALKMTARVNWLRARAGSVVVIEGANYAAA
ncbi:hypothetical protein ASC76_17780 [Rhizobacter sp. Root404]|nr:hypothetical protein ASC76_17780 [Rhizobacter sp. Root404]